MKRNLFAQARSLHMTFFLGLLALIGCTETIEYDELVKENHYEKSHLSTDELYLYVPSVTQVGRTTKATRPQVVGQAKLVRFRFTEESLDLVEVDADTRFRKEANLRPVLSVPIKHFSYRCQQDAYGDCLQREEENEEISWEQREYFQPDFNGVKIHETNFLPIDLANLFQNCYSELDSKVRKAELDSESLNFEIEKTMKGGIECDRIESLSDTSFFVRTHYSIVKLDRLATQNYQKITYSDRAQNTFGFFDTETNHLSHDHRNLETGKERLLNRWHPKKTISYALDPKFSLEENELLREATLRSIDIINSSLEKAGSQLRLQALESTGEFAAGDLRQNSIVLVEDPLAINVLGYGPSIANPLTGEILHARTVMFPGVMKKFIHISYNELVEQIQSEKTKNDTNLPLTSSSEWDSNNLLVSSLTQGPSLLWKETFKEITARMTPLDDGDFARVATQPSEEELHSHLRKLSKNMDGSLEERIEILSRHSMYPAEMYNFSGNLKEQLRGHIEKNDYQLWEQLSQKEQRAISENLLPYVWVPTLVHEMGHNLGLRHNFSGSTDKENFYTKQELQTMGISHEIPYSSVMDYPHTDINHLPIMGRYDIAALRFAYSSQVELQDGQLATLSDHSLSGLNLKNFEYCTDENVSVSPVCNRFDEGTDLVEITAHQIRAYEDRYRRRNFRNGRASFSTLDAGSYFSSINQSFRHFRMIFELYESIRENYRISDEDISSEESPWNSEDFLRQLKLATEMTANHFINVITTPDLHCILQPLNSQGEQATIAVPIRAISMREISCFDLELSPRVPYKVVGEAGKSFLSRKSPHSNNPYLDQIDVRGFWMDKFLASHYLLARKVGVPSMDRFQGNYLDVPWLRNQIMSALIQTILDELGPQKRPMLLSSGLTSDVTKDFRLMNHEETYVFPGDRLGKATGIKQPLPLNTYLVHELYESVTNTTTAQRYWPIQQALERYASDVEGISDFEEMKELTVGTRRYVALQENTLAREIMARIAVIRTLQGEEIQNVAQALENIRTSDRQHWPVGSLEQRIVGLTPSLVQRYSDGKLLPLTHYYELLKSLPESR